ncbi:MAG: long-chain fatty acid--CoA ligase [Deltaproteobacteria bacterium]|nr:long-chain fatty acid--CoA ligase [Deltaproteobacteria bacterium]
MLRITCRDKPWLKFYDRRIPEHIEYEPACLPEFLDRSAAGFPDRPALIFEGYRITFRELKDMVDQCAACLSRFGITRGDSVAILLPNVVPLVVSYFAVLKTGAVAVVNNPLYSDPELERQFNDSGSRLLITLDILANRMIALRPRTSIRTIIHCSLGDYLPRAKKILFRLVGGRMNLAASVRRDQDVYSWKTCMERGTGEETAVSPVLQGEDIAMYQYTGGTSGVSKAVMLTHRNLSTQVQALRMWFQDVAGRETVILGALPFFHIFGLTAVMNLAVYLGWTTVLLPRPQPKAILAAVRKYRPLFAPLVPAMFIGILKEPALRRTDMSCLVGCFSGGAPLPVEVMHDFEKTTGVAIMEGFGMTETSPVTHVNPVTGRSRKVGSVGIPISDTECRIVDLDTGTDDVPAGGRGELLVRGPQVMKGYKDASGQEEQLLKEGWLHTGDIATMDEDGFFYIVGRKKDVIISSGYNIYPRDIDDVFTQHPKVRETFTVGVPDERRGESVKVFVVPREGATVTEEELLAFCRDKLAKYKWPAHIEFRRELPRTRAGKIDRMALKDTARDA